MVQRTMGIYAITNKITGEQYIGGSSRIEGRWKDHCTLLNDGRHHCKKLQAAWREYGEPSFEFSLLESVACREDLKRIEQGYIDRLKPHYNGRLNTGSQAKAKLKPKPTKGIPPSRFYGMDRGLLY